MELNVILNLVQLVAVVILYICAVILNKKNKELKYENELLNADLNQTRLNESATLYSLCGNLNRVSKTILDKLPKTLDSYRVSLEMKKTIMMYIAYYREYDEEFDWDLTKVKAFTEETTVAKEAKILLTHIKEGSTAEEKERVQQAIAYLLLKC